MKKIALVATLSVAIAAAFSTGAAVFPTSASFTPFAAAPIASPKPGKDGRSRPSTA